MPQDKGTKSDERIGLSKFPVMKSVEIDKSYDSKAFGSSPLGTTYLLERFGLMSGFLDSMQGTATVPLGVYLQGTPTKEQALSIEAAMQELAKALGGEIAFDAPAATGSWKKEIWIRVKGFFGREEVQRRIRTLESGVKKKYIGTEQAAIDAKQAEAVKMVLESIKEFRNAVVQVGSTMILKVTPVGSADATLAVCTLTISQMEELEHCPTLKLDPVKLLKKLQSKAKLKKNSKQKVDKVTAGATSFDLAQRKIEAAQQTLDSAQQSASK